MSRLITSYPRQVFIYKTAFDLIHVRVMLPEPANHGVLSLHALVQVVQRGHFALAQLEAGKDIFFNLHMFSVYQESIGK